MKNIIKYIFLFHLLMFCAWAYPSTYTLPKSDFASIAIF